MGECREERKPVQAEVQRLIKQNKARWEHKIAAAAEGLHVLGGNKASLGRNYNSDKQATRKEKRLLLRKEIARNVYRGIHKRKKLEKAVLGWKFVSEKTRAKLLEDHTK